MTRPIDYDKFIIDWRDRKPVQIGDPQRAAEPLRRSPGQGQHTPTPLPHEVPQPPPRPGP